MKAEYEDGTYSLIIILNKDDVVGTTAVEMTSVEVEFSNDSLRRALSDMDAVFEFDTKEGWAIIPARSIRWIHRIKVD